MCATTSAVGIRKKHYLSAVEDLTDYAIDEIPCTLNGKKLEKPVIKILSGTPLYKVVNVDALSNPQAVDYIVKLPDKALAPKGIRYKTGCALIIMFTL